MVPQTWTHLGPFFPYHVGRPQLERPLPTERLCWARETDLGRPWAPESSSTPGFPSFYSQKVPLVERASVA